MHIHFDPNNELRIAYRVNYQLNTAFEFENKWTENKSPGEVHFVKGSMKINVRNGGNCGYLRSRNLKKSLYPESLLDRFKILQIYDVSDLYFIPPNWWSYRTYTINTTMPFWGFHH